MKRKLLILTAALLTAILFVTGCQKEASAEFPGEDATYDAATASLGASNRFAGVVTASGETKIEKDESKAVAKVKVAAGDIVKKGQVLFVYDSEQAQLNYDKANLELEQLKYSLQSYNDQKAALEREKASAGEGEQLSYTIQIQEIDTDIREAEYNIKAKQKEVDKLKSGLKNLKVKSPINGKIQSINAEGSIDQNGNALPYMVIMNTGLYRVKAYINEVNAMELYEGASVTIRSRMDDATWTGTVASVDFDNPASSQQNYMTDDISEVASTSKYPFYVELDSADGLILGQHVFVEVDVEFSNPVPEEEPSAEEGMPIEEAGPGMEGENGMSPDFEMDAAEPDMPVDEADSPDVDADAKN